MWNLEIQLLKHGLTFNPLLNDSCNDFVLVLLLSSSLSILRLPATRAPENGWFIKNIKSMVYFTSMVNPHGHKLLRYKLLAPPPQPNIRSVDFV